MKIEKLETFVAVNWMMVRITTDTGIQGVGESTFFGWPGASENVVLSFEPYLIGRGPAADRAPLELHVPGEIDAWRCDRRRYQRDRPSVVGYQGQVF